MTASINVKAARIQAVTHLLEPRLLALYRSRARTIRQIVSLLIVGVTASYFLYSYQSSAQTYDIACGIVFGLWTLFILWSALKKRLLFQETPGGFTARGPFRYHMIEWDQLVVVGKRDISDRMLLLIWKSEPAGKEKFLPLSRKSLGAGNLDRISELIMEKRPDLPSYSRGEINALANNK